MTLSQRLILLTIAVEKFVHVRTHRRHLILNLTRLRSIESALNSSYSCIKIEQIIKRIAIVRARSNGIVIVFSRIRHANDSFADRIAVVRISFCRLVNRRKDIATQKLEIQSDCSNIEVAQYSAVVDRRHVLVVSHVIETDDFRLNHSCCPPGIVTTLPSERRTNHLVVARDLHVVIDEELASASAPVNTSGIAVISDFHGFLNRNRRALARHLLLTLLNDRRLLSTTFFRIKLAA